MKRSNNNQDEKQSKKQKLSKECKIIDTIYIKPHHYGEILTPCSKFLILPRGSCIYKLNLKTKLETVIAGSISESSYNNGNRNETRFVLPYNLEFSKDLKTMYVFDIYCNILHAICIKSGESSTLTGNCKDMNGDLPIDGPKESAYFSFVHDLKITPDGNTLFVSDNGYLRSVCIATGEVHTIAKYHDLHINILFVPDGRHIYIYNSFKFIKCSLSSYKCVETMSFDKVNKSVFSKDGQFLFIANGHNINIINISTNEVIGKIHESKTMSLLISKNGQQLYVCDSYNGKIKVLDISNYCSNFKTFAQSQFSKYSFLPRQVIKSFSI